MSLKNIVTMIRNRANREQIYSKADFWDAKADHYEGDAVSMWANNNLNRLYHAEQLAIFDQFLPHNRPLRILDVGCGTGRIARFLAQKGHQVDARDFSAKSIAVARSLSTGTNPNYAVESVFDLGETGQYDAVVSWGVLAIAATNRAELRDAFAKIHRSLRPGGRLVILEPFHRGFLHRVLNAGVSDVKSDLNTSGFVLQSVQPMHFWPVRLLTAFITLPMSITKPVYQLGQFVMNRVGNLGDYTAMYAEKDPTFVSTNRSAAGLETPAHASVG